MSYLADEIARYGYKKPDEIFSIAPADAQQFQLSSAQHRFEQLAPGQAKSGHIHNLGDYPEEVRNKKTDFDARLESDLAQAAHVHG